MFALAEFKKLPIWKQFEEDKSVKFDLDDLFEYALSLLDLYYKAFPKYTLHNQQHQYNIIKLMGELLGNRVKNLNKLECAILILSAAYHDIGMVFNDSELNNIEAEETFKSFLNGNHKGKLEYHENNCVLTSGLAEWYCRWMHAQRVWLFLDKLDGVKWKSRSLRETIGKVCESHNVDVKVLNEEGYFPNVFKNDADIKFCAILLRLADIMDFDNSRTPKSVYEFLDLGNPKNRNEKISSEEWAKHLCSEGFSIAYVKEDIQISFCAGPEHPQIEKNIDNFLDIIVDEFIKCSGALSHCSDRWRNFRLPLTIDRSGISSENYKKGDYRLSLDEKQIIHLLVGENLYDGKFVFIRELLQNAIDTSRMREYHEHTIGNNEFKAHPIAVNTWVDEDGYRWVRVDDYGMGINEYVVMHHLLRKGTSFYQSDVFKIQKLHYREKTKSDFTPISRFGIGLLSCFMLGDLIEISTRALAMEETGSEEQRLRLSLAGLHSQYFLQTEKDRHKPTEMPNVTKNEKGFRKNFGTSIAIRIDRSKDYSEFEVDLGKAIESYVITSPIEVVFSEKMIGLDFLDTLENPKADYVFWPFSQNQKRRIEREFKVKITGELGVEVLPLDITKSSVNSKLKGQIVLLRVKSDNIDLVDNVYDVDDEISFGFTAHKQKIYFEIESTRRGKGYLMSIKLPEFKIEKNFRYKIEKYLSDYSSYHHGIDLIHNGISIPSRDLFYFRERYNSIYFSTAFYGIVHLEDNLIPNLSVSRNQIKSLSFPIVSALKYAARGLSEFVPRKAYEYFNVGKGNYSLGEIKSDLLISSGVWDSEKIIKVEGKYCSVKELSQKAQKNRRIAVEVESAFSEFVDYLPAALLQLNFNLEFEMNTGRLYVVGCRSATFDISPIDVLSPLSFVPFDCDEILCRTSGNSYDVNSVNSRHWFTRWIVGNQEELLRDFEGYFHNLVSNIRIGNVEAVNKILVHLRKSLRAGSELSEKVISENDFVVLEEEF